MSGSYRYYSLRGLCECNTVYTSDAQLGSNMAYRYLLLEISMHFKTLKEVHYVKLNSEHFIPINFLI